MPKKNGKDYRRTLSGLIGVTPREPVPDNYSLSIVYTPGVAEPCKEIQNDREASYKYTWRANSVAVVGAGPEDLPKLESISALLKILAGIDGVPLVVSKKRVETIQRIACTFGAVWLAGIKPAESEKIIEALSVDVPVVPPAKDEYAVLACPAVYPGVFRAAIDLRVKNIPREMAEAASEAVGDSEFHEAAILASKAAAEYAKKKKLAKTKITPQQVAERVKSYLETGRVAPFEAVADWVNGNGLKETALRLHAGQIGTLSMKPKIEPRNPERLFEVFDDGSAASKEIKKNPKKADDLTNRCNTVAVVTDGTAVLGLGDIGALAGLPVMLGKSVLFKMFGGCDAIPISVESKDVNEICDVVESIAPTFGGINLEDISSPRCFLIEAELKKRLDIFVFHDDQHGTAVVSLAGLINAAKLAGKKLSELTVTFNGAGAAGIAVAKLMLAAGVQDVILCDRSGAIYKGRPENMNAEKDQMAEWTNRDRIKGGLADALRGRNVFVGLSVAGALKPEMIKGMASKPIILAMANPVPEILPDEAYAAGAAAVATGRSDFPNQINNCLGFPGIFRGAMDVRARNMNDTMKRAAAEAIASMVPDDKLSRDYFIPSAMDLRVPPAIAAATARAAIETGEARIKVNPADVALRTKRYLYTGRLS